MDRQNEHLMAAFAAELAERADVSARFISFLETGRHQPSLSALYALSKGLGIRMRDLIDEVDCQFDLQGSDDQVHVDTE